MGGPERLAHGGGVAGSGREVPQALRPDVAVAAGSRGMACRSQRSRLVLRLAATLWVGVIAAAPELHAHDPSAYGGLFRSRNLGQSWVNADTGLFVNAALSVAVDPRDPAHLLFGTDVGLVESRNGGRAWKPAATESVIEI